MFKKSFISFILLLSVISSLLFSGCSGETNSSSIVSESSNEESTESKSESVEDDSKDSSDVSGEVKTEIVDIAYSDLVKKDLNQREVYIIQRWFGYGKPEMNFTGEVLYMESEYGGLDEVNQAKADIMAQIEKDYNCKIKGELFGEGSVNIVGDLKTLVENDILTKTGKYDILFESPYWYSSFARDSHLKDINSISTINTKSTCWDMSAVSGLSVKDKLYFLTGDINTYDNSRTTVLLFNKELYKKSGYKEDLYELVKNGEWTFDKLKSLSLSFENIDNNEDGKRDEYDFWFLGSNKSNLYSHVIASGGSIFKKNSSDELVFTMDEPDTLTALSNAVDFYKSGSVLVSDAEEYKNKYPIPEWSPHMLNEEAFLSGRMLFQITDLGKITYYRQMEDEFGILPMPKSSVDADYYSACSPSVMSTLMIPAGVNADDDLGLVIQALGELSEEKLTEVYYKSILKQGDKTDTESRECLGIIFDNRYYDLGAIFGKEFGNPHEMYESLQGDFKEKIEAEKADIQASFDAFVSKFE